MDPPFRQLSSFDRIAVSFPQSSISSGPIFITTRGSVSFDSSTEKFMADAPASLSGNAIWGPGAASFVLHSPKVSNGQIDTSLTVVEYPSGVTHPLTAKFDRLRTTAGPPREFTRPRWVGTSTGVRVLTSLRGAGVVSAFPDGSSPKLVLAGTLSESPMFADGRATVNGQATHIIRRQDGSIDATYDDLFVSRVTGVGTTVGPIVQTRLMDTPFVTEYQPALSPDETKVVYIEGRFQDQFPENKLGELFVVNTDGSDRHRVSPSTSLIYSRPTWRADGQRIAFIGYDKPGQNGIVGAPVLYSMAPDGTDLVRHTVESTSSTLVHRNPYPLGININGLFPRSVSWGRTCVTMVSCASSLTLVSDVPGDLEVQSQPQLASAASIGFLVERYRGRRLVSAGRVPFGLKTKGRKRVRWKARLGGRALAAGRYRITLRVLAAGGIPLELSRPVDLIVPRRGKARLARAKVK